ncbi:MAG TPA: uracil-DNA glycosylase [Bryobacteraceae bacterium]|nr:uracil-DNA glycosylase [Bryobacteraceae bacterium]
MSPALNPLAVLENDIISCTRCARLVAHCAAVARIKRRAYREQTYWGRPVPGFGDPDARLFILGLAPGAHGANRTGRVFTGDRSGDFLYAVLHAAGFASQPASIARGDGLTMHDAWISASVRCAPPDNRPSSEEIATCREFLSKELALLANVRLIVALGRIAHDNYLAVTGERRASYCFGHGHEHRFDDGRVLIDSYHPSQQNTSTGKLTTRMLTDVFERARVLLAATAGSFRSRGDDAHKGAYPTVAAASRR